jgi:hypothetical protein
MPNTHIEALEKAVKDRAQLCRCSDGLTESQPIATAFLGLYQKYHQNSHFRTTQYPNT